MANDASTRSGTWDRLADIPAFSPLDKIEMRAFAGQNVMLNLVTLNRGAVVPEHSHANEQMGYVLRGTLVLTIAGETRNLEPGDCYLAPGGVSHSATTLDEGCDVIDIFSPPRQDYAEAAAKARRDGAGS
jgi:quercetin dioxygenase-like cupin family protein